MITTTHFKKLFVAVCLGDKLFGVLCSNNYNVTACPFTTNRGGGGGQKS